MHPVNVFMNTRLLLTWLGMAALSACAQTPNAGSTKPAQTATTASAPVAATPAVSGLTEPILYTFLLGEIAGQRGEDGLAAEALAEVASKTRDTRLVRRAVEFALKARKAEEALGLANLWVELEPNSYKARQVLIPLLIGQERYAVAMPHLRAVLAMKDRTPAMSFMHLQSLLGRYKNKMAGLVLVRELAQGYETLPEAQYAVAQAAWQANQYDQAADALDLALRAKPGWETAALMRGQLIQRQDDAAMLAYWKTFLQVNPDANEVRMAYAKALAKAGRYHDARAEFTAMAKKAGNQAEIKYAIGLLSMQIDDLDGAESSFQEALKQGYNDDDTIRLYLAQISETRHRYEEALKRYDEVGPGDRYLDARLKGALVLGKLKRVTEGRSRLEQLNPANDSERVRIFQAEAQMMREGGDALGAFAVLDRAVRAMPDSDDLLYDRAMAAEKINRLDILEADLRRIIEIDPNHAHAYNALGYTLADRTKRIDEAIALLEKALKLSPDDAFILDSMGWAMFKARRFDEAENYLRRAYEARPDPEIAAHFGEVLWQRAKRDEARKLWGDASKKFPENDVLRETMARLMR
jgi:tetratricopeptide (TPR) repeat protein